MNIQVAQDHGERWADARLVHDVIWPQNNAGWWDRGLRPGDEFLFVATDEDLVIGYLLGEFYSGWSVGHEVAVSPDRQGQGAGVELIRAWARHSIHHGTPTLLAHPLPGPTWERLDRFYRSIGFRDPEIDSHLQAQAEDVLRLTVSHPGGSLPT